MRWLRGGDPEEQRRTALAQLFGVLGESAISSAMALRAQAKKLGVEEARFTGESFFRTSLEFLYCYLHLTDRSAFSNLGVAKRDALIDSASDWCIRHLVSSSIDSRRKEQLESIQDWALAEFEQREQEYGSCSDINVTEHEMSSFMLGFLGIGSGNPYPDSETDPIGAAIVGAGREMGKAYDSIVGRLSAHIAEVIGERQSLRLLVSVLTIVGAATDRMDLRKKVVNAGRYLP